jgi:hypothetical protein
VLYQDGSPFCQCASIHVFDMERKSLIRQCGMLLAFYRPMGSQKFLAQLLTFSDTSFARCRGLGSHRLWCVRFCMG